MYSLKQCITLHKNSGGAAAKTGKLQPLSPIAGATTGKLYKKFSTCCTYIQTKA